MAWYDPFISTAKDVTRTFYDPFNLWGNVVEPGIMKRAEDAPIIQRDPVQGSAIPRPEIDPKIQEEALKAEKERLAQTEQSRIQAEVLKRQQSTLADALKLAYGQVTAAGEQNLNNQYGDAKRRLIAEEAALGRLGSGVGGQSAARLENQRLGSLATFLGEVASNRATNELDFAKAIEGIQQNERRAQEESLRFREDLGIRRQSLAEQIRQFSENLGLERNRLSMEDRLGNEAVRIKSRANDIASENAKIQGIVGGLEGLGKLAMLGESNESFCGIRAIKNVLNEMGVAVNLSDIFKVVETRGYKEIDHGYLTVPQIQEVLSDFGVKADVATGTLSDDGSHKICAVHCTEYYGIPNESWAHAVVLTPEKKCIDGYEWNLEREYPNGTKLVENAKNFDWSSWSGVYFKVRKVA